MAVFRRICREAFAIPEGSIDGVIEYLNEFGYETNASQAIAMFRDLDRDRRIALARHMADIAKADSKLVDEEMRMLKRILEMLRLDSKDCAPAGRAGAQGQLSPVPASGARLPGQVGLPRPALPASTADDPAHLMSCRSPRCGPRPSPGGRR